MTQNAQELVPWRFDSADNERLDDPQFDVERLNELSPSRYLVGGKRIPFFTTGQLAWMLGRSPVTIREWEYKGILPRTPFVRSSPDLRGSRRLYTRDQVLAVVQIAREEGVLRMYGPVIRSTNFTTRVEEYFKKLLRPV